MSERRCDHCEARLCTSFQVLHGEFVRRDGTTAESMTILCRLVEDHDGPHSYEP